MKYLFTVFFVLVVLESLTKLSTDTNILEDPNCLTELSRNALLYSDPTNIPSKDDQHQHQQLAEGGASAVSGSGGGVASSSGEQWNEARWN